jgi:hypothetical protein
MCFFDLIDIKMGLYMPNIEAELSKKLATNQFDGFDVMPE